MFLLFEASSPSKPGFTARISTPAFDSTNKCLRFVYNLRGIGGSLLKIYQSTDQGKYLLANYNQSLESGHWKGAVLKLMASTTSRITFEAVRGIHYAGDVAIDDVEISDDCQDGNFLFFPIDIQMESNLCYAAPVLSKHFQVF